uniref:AraC family transcriptional regulator n=1 Tax=Setaria digitata TaxID=48799 RepID=A0A915PYF3_9BILA
MSIFQPYSTPVDFIVDTPQHPATYAKLHHRLWLVVLRGRKEVNAGVRGRAEELGEDARLEFDAWAISCTGSGSDERRLRVD